MTHDAAELLDSRLTFRAQRFCVDQILAIDRARAAGDRDGEHRALVQTLQFLVRLRADRKSEAPRRLGLGTVLRTLASRRVEIELADIQATFATPHLGLFERALLVECTAGLALLHRAWSGDSATWLPWLRFADDHLPDVIRQRDVLAPPEAAQRFRILQGVVNSAIASSYDEAGRPALGDWPWAIYGERTMAVDGGTAEGLLARLFEVFDRVVEFQNEDRSAAALAALEAFDPAETRREWRLLAQLLDTKGEELRADLAGEPLVARSAVERQLAIFARAMNGLPPMLVGGLMLLGLRYDIKAKRGDLVWIDCGQILCLPGSADAPAAAVWRAYAMVAEWAYAVGHPQSGCFFTKMGLRELRAAGAHFWRVAGDAPSEEDVDAHTMSQFHTSQLIRQGRLSEATEVIELQRSVDGAGQPLSLTTLERQAAAAIDAALTDARAHPSDSTHLALAEALRTATILLTPASTPAPAPPGLDASPSGPPSLLTDAIPAGTAVVHFAVQESQVDAIVNLGDGPAVVRLDVKGEGHINQLVAFVLERLVDTRTDPTKWLLGAFGVLLAPLLPHLTRASRIVVSAPGTLHGFPWAALHDGEHYAAERWTWVRAGVSTSDLRAPLRAPAVIVGCAATRASARLPALGASARDELTAIEHTVSGRMLVDDRFTRAALAQALRSATIVHVASHFVPRPGDLEQSELLLGDGSRITVTELVELGLANLDLIVLSACRSGIADAQGAYERATAIDTALLMGGSRASIGMLWPVDSEATSWMMAKFYRQLRRGADKDIALASAQRALLTGAAGGRWRQPFFWAAPALSGNWLGWASPADAAC